MELLRKEIGIIALTIHNAGADVTPSVHTEYDYGLVIDPLLNKPAFTLCSLTRICYSETDFILCRCYVVFVLEPSGEAFITGEDLWYMTLEGRESLNGMLQEKLGPVANLPRALFTIPDHGTEAGKLSQLALAAFRLN